jgi:hypothetical protein
MLNFGAKRLNKVVGEYKLTVLGVSAVRWKGNGRTENANGNIFAYSGMPNADDDHITGEGILVTFMESNRPR